MKRKIYSQLLDWKQNSNGKSALLIEGARRIGKSYIIEEFAKQEYESYILIDFNDEDPEVQTLFHEHITHLDMFFFVLHTNDVEQKDGITFLPVYMAGLL